MFTPPHSVEPPRAKDYHALSTFLEQNRISFIRFTAIDLGSVPRAIVVPKAAAVDIATKGFAQAGVSPLACAVSIGDRLVADLLETGVDEVRPDWTSLKACTYYPTHGTVMCFIRNPQDGKPRGGYAIDPRSALLNQISLARESGIEFLVGLEIELFITDKDNTFTQLPGKHIPMGLDFLRGKLGPLMDEIVLAIERAGFKVMKYHTDGTIEGVLEIVLAPLPPTEAADAMSYCHETIKTISAKHNLKATMSPMPFETGFSIGAHTNISISKPDEGNAESFLAGLLSQLPSVTAFSMPNYESSNRLGRVKRWIHWGKDNKKSIIRERFPGCWEVRCADGTMNPYLAFAAIIVAGMHGVRNKLPLEIKPSPYMTKDTSDEQRKELNITKHLPRSLEDAIDDLADNLVFKDEKFGFGKDMINAYCRLKKDEIDFYSGLTGLERRLHNIRIF
ncbi:putative protein flug [Phaeomoniella chlamydospora]|uniref:GS catalytic domain-containing protein n=1 Tax=Phaeomoniella chlamydospora TaxID=158046 RepID=A0A0G2HLE5_PHACM|nr:putative protein flug [Phaeomoniella chlamydospora]